MKKIKYCCLAAAMLPVVLSCQPALAGEEWDVKMDAQGSYGDYSNSALREDIWSTGVFVAADYLDSVGVTAGYNRIEVNFKNGIATLTQNAYFASVRKHFTPDALPGRLTLRLDGHWVDNNDPTDASDDGKIVAPQIAYLAFDKSFYADVGYAYSNYAGNLDLHQVTPTIGFGFNQNSDWLQLRGYFIYSSNTARTQGKRDTYAAELKLTHYFSPDAILNISRLQATVLAGERIYAVDADTADVYNLADTQEEAFSLAGIWDLNDSWSMQLVGSYSNYQFGPLGDDYSNRSVFLNISKSW